MDIRQHLRPLLNQREQGNLYRKRRVISLSRGATLYENKQSYHAFSSNDYLGLANHPNVIEAFTAAAKKYGVGSGASHLVCGHQEEHHLLEDELAEFTGRERALLFSSGYMANLGVINALAERGDAVFEDRLNHASLLDGGLLSRAKFHRFAHNDMTALECNLVASQARRKLIVVDGVFSMDGDVAPLPDIVHLADAHGGWVMVDDAHGFGYLGHNGGGCAEHFNLSQSQLPILMGTLGKAFGTFGAFVAGCDELIEALIQFSRTYIYTTALPPAIAAATRASLQILRTDSWRREHLAELITQFRSGAKTLGVQLMDSTTPIQPVVLNDASRTLAVARALEAEGFLVGAIRPPTVPNNSARLRITLSADHSSAQVDALLTALEYALKRYPQ